MQKQRIEFANSLRGIACLSVLLSHFFGIFWYNRPIVSVITGLPEVPGTIPAPSLVENTIGSQAIGLGPFGVALFFLISGFVIPFSFERHSRLQFAIGRLARIWPTYFVGFAYTAGVITLGCVIAGRSPPFDFVSALIHSIVGLRDAFGITSIDHVVWTLEIEIKFYLIAAALGPLLWRGSALCYIAPALVAAFCASPFTSGPTRITGCFLILMFVGVSLSAWYRRKQGAFRTASSVIALLVCAGWVASKTDIPAWAIFSNYLATSGVFVVAMLGSAGFPRIAVLRYLADVSYPLYVVHGAAGYTLMSLFLSYVSPSPMIAVLFASAIAVLAAQILHVLIERPSHRIGKDLAASLSSFLARRDSEGATAAARPPTP